MKNYKIKICPLCKKSFKPTSANQIYCGSRIKKIGCAFVIYKRERKEYKKTEKYKKWKKEYQKKCYQSEAYWKRRHRDKQKYRKVVFRHYSNGVPKCANCGIKNLDVLELDHIKNDGAKERKIRKSGTQFYRWLVKNNFPSGYQVLCRNCNWLKYLEYKKRF